MKAFAIRLLVVVVIHGVTSIPILGPSEAHGKPSKNAMVQDRKDDGQPDELPEYAQGGGAQATILADHYYRHDRANCPLSVGEETRKQRRNSSPHFVFQPSRGE